MSLRWRPPPPSSQHIDSPHRSRERLRRRRPHAPSLAPTWEVGRKLSNLRDGGGEEFLVLSLPPSLPSLLDLDHKLLFRWLRPQQRRWRPMARPRVGVLRPVPDDTAFRMGARWPARMATLPPRAGVLLCCSPLHGVVDGSISCCGV
jgi:hypothetical protein